MFATIYRALRSARLAALLVILAACAQAGRAAGFAMRSGIISAVSSNAITVIDDRSQTTTYPVAPGAIVSLDGKPAAMADLKPGQSVRIALNSGDAGAVYATTAAQTIPCKISAVTPALLTVVEPIGQGVTASFPLTAATRYVLYGQPGALSDLRTGMIAQVTVVDKATASVAISRPDNGLIDGAIAFISPGAITVSRGIDKPITYTIDAATRAYLDGKPVPLSRLHADLPVRVVSDDGLAAYTISAATPVSRGQRHHDGAGS